jgi:trimethylamine:corrinoid methyltransferase-like protein
LGLALAPVLKEYEIDQIHAKSLEILESVGIDFKTARALEVLEKAGCRVDYEQTRAWIPKELVEWSLEQAPRVVRLPARDPERTVVLNGRRSYNTTDSQGTQAIDLESGECRDSTAEDLRRVVLFADALDKVDIVNTTVSASDVPAHIRTLRQFALAFSNTSKPVRSGVLNAQQVPLLVEMVKAVTGSQTFEPIFSVVNCTISPLMHDRTMTEACIELAKLKVPIVVYPMPLAGGTSPVTLAGTILIHNIEFLSGLVLFQAVNPGTPVIYGGGASQLDMQTGRYGGSADGHGMRLALAEIAQAYNLPVNLWGMSTSSQQLDAHYGSQAITQTLLAYLAGADEIYSHGMLGDAQILSLEKMVCDNHLLHQLETVICPVIINDETLQVDLIRSVGIGGSYLAQKKTRDYTRKGYVRMWPPAGKTMLEIARAEAFEILHEHQPPPLPPGAEKRLEEIIASADKDLS